MTEPISNDSTFCYSLQDLGQWIYDLAMRVFKAVQDFFCPVRSVSEPRPITSATVAATPQQLIDFYQGTAPNNNGVTLDQILNWDDGQLESVHNYIQWLFPLTTPSGPNPTAPVLDPQTIRLFCNNRLLTEQVKRSFHRMLAFYGLHERAGTFSRAPNFASRAAIWLTPNNHNFLRITRILHSLKLLGLPQHSQAFLQIMSDIAAHEGAGIVTAGNLRFWQNAAS